LFSCLNFTLFVLFFFFFIDTATTEIYTLSLHDALPISKLLRMECWWPPLLGQALWLFRPRRPQEPSAELVDWPPPSLGCRDEPRSEEHTSELQSLAYLVCRLLLEKKKQKKNTSLLSQFS